MFSKSFTVVLIVTTLATVILSIPLDNVLQVIAPSLVAEEAALEQELAQLEPDSNIGPDMQIAQERFLQNFFNLSSYFTNAPNDSAALTFVPLGSLLFSLLG